MFVMPACYNAGDTIYFPFDTYDSSGGSVTISGFAVTDIECFKNGSTTERASDNGYSLLDTDGTDFDGRTGIHGFSIDTSDNSDAGFWADGTTYFVAVDAITVDGQTVRFNYLVPLGYLLRPTTPGNKLTVSNITDIKTKIDFLPSVAAGAAGGVFIAGTNAATAITSSSGPALSLTSTGSNGAGLFASGNGSGAGIQGTGGATGQGILGTGGATSGSGIRGTATGSNSVGIRGDGAVGGAGIQGVGNSAGPGILGTSGATTGTPGIQGTGSTNAAGIRGSGAGTGAGIQGIGGATGQGILGTGGSSSGAGIRGTGTAGNAEGILGVGQGSAAGVRGTGGATGQGILGVGGATSGAGIRGTATAGNSHGIYGVGEGSGSGLSGLGGSTGHGLLGQGGTNGDGIKGALGGTGVDIRGNITGNVTGNLSGSCSSVTGDINTAGGTIKNLDALDTAQDTQHSTTQTDIAGVPAAVEAAILDEGDATALLAAIAAKVEEFLINEGDATATIAAIAAAVNAAVEAGQVGSDTAAILEDTDTTIPAQIAALNDVSADEVADQVWDEILTEHLGAGSTGNALNAAGSAGDPWATALPGAYGAGTAGNIIGTNLDAAISTRSTLDAAGIRLAVGLASDNLDIQLADLPTVAEFNARTLPSASYALEATVLVIDTYLDTEIAAILEDTGTTIPAQIAALNNISQAQVKAQADAALTTTTYAEPGQGTPAATASLASKIGHLYKVLRNKTVADSGSGFYEIYNDDGATVDHKATISDVGGVATRGELVTGP